MPKSPSFKLKSQVLRLSENDVEKACLDLVSLHGYYPIRLHAGLFRSADGKRWIRGVDKGTPDYIVLGKLGKRVFFLEVKRPGEHLRPDQEKKIWELEAFYSLDTAVVDNVEELAAWLARRERSP
jgi:hypothetical protein